LKTVLSL